ncbi:MAG: hypothetical protein AB7K24_15190 [Gemmataceae bacterium]
MIRQWPLYLLVFGFLWCAGAQTSADTIPAPAQTALDKGAKLELFALSPDPEEGKNAKEAFHGYKVLNKTTLEGGDKSKIAAAFKKAVAANQGKAAFCFNPRHGIRVVHDKKTVDFLICFECFQVHLFIDGKEAKGFLTENSAQPVFDAMLKKAAK